MPDRSLPAAVPGYRDLCPIGRGGLTVVYRAYQEETGRTVAVKVFTRRFVDAAAEYRFARHTPLAKMLNRHPNVVSLLDLGMTGSGLPYVTTGYFAPGSLGDRLVAEGPLPVPDVLRIGVTIAAAIGFAHQKGFLHGAVTPRNILVAGTGEPALADFFTARLAFSFGVPEWDGYPPHHVPPEQFRGEPPTGSVDVYLLGSTLYHLLAGEPPFRGHGENAWPAVGIQVVRDEPPPITRPDLPAAVAAAVTDTVLRALAKHPAGRYPDIRSFGYALQRLQRDLGLPVTAPASR